jgi:hypothetical protein
MSFTGKKKPIQTDDEPLEMSTKSTRLQASSKDELLQVHPDAESKDHRVHAPSDTELFDDEEGLTILRLILPELSRLPCKLTLLEAFLYLPLERNLILLRN